MSQSKTVPLTLTPRRIRDIPRVAHRVTFALIARYEVTAFKDGRTRRAETHDPHASVESRKRVWGSGRDASTTP